MSEKSITAVMVQNVVSKQFDAPQASLLSGKIFNPSSTSAPSNMVHSGMHTNVTLTSASFSSLAHSVRQKPSFSSMAVRYQARRRSSGEPLRGSYPGLQRPAILMASMRMRMLSKTQTGRKMRNQFHCTWRVEIRRWWKHLSVRGEEIIYNMTKWKNPEHNCEEYYNLRWLNTCCMCRLVRSQSLTTLGCNDNKNRYLSIQFEHQHDKKDQGENPGQQNPLSQRHQVAGGTRERGWDTERQHR